MRIEKQLLVPPVGTYRHAVISAMSDKWKTAKEIFTRLPSIATGEKMGAAISGLVKDGYLELRYSPSRWLSREQQYRLTEVGRAVCDLITSPARLTATDQHLVGGAPNGNAPQVA